MDIYSVTKSSTPSLVLPTQLPSMKLGDKTMMVLEIDEYCCPGPFYSAPALEGIWGALNQSTYYWSLIIE